MTPDQLTAEGWSLYPADGFSGWVGPYWRRGSGEALEVGFFAEERHGNVHIGSVHGGILASFADVALGMRVVDEVQALNLATAQLQLHYVAVARFGDFICCRPELIRRTPDLIFVRGLIRVGDKVVASVDGIWKMLRLRAG